MTTSREPALISSPARALRLSAGLAVAGLVSACAGAPEPAPPAHTTRPVTVVVSRGDTLWGLARQHGVALQALASANGLAPPYRIRPGQVLHLPGTARTSAATQSERAPAAQIPLPAPVPAPLPAPTVETVTAAQARERTVTAEPLPPPGRFAWPVRGQVVSGFGAKGGGLVNDGMNIAAPRGTPVRAAADGTVIYAGNEVRGFGNLVLIRHEGGWVTAYGHAERLLVRQGQRVRAGEEIARVGSSGAVTTPQLHFQIRRDGRPVDPAAHLERAVANRAP